MLCQPQGRPDVEAKGSIPEGPETPEHIHSGWFLCGGIPRSVTAALFLAVLAKKIKIEKGK